MAVNRENTGYDGNVVRDSVQKNIDRIDQLLLDPIWVSNKANNKAKKGAPEGTIVYEFSFEGQLNQAEKDSVLNGWEANGWSDAEIINNHVVANDSADNRTWTLRLTYNP